MAEIFNSRDARFKTPFGAVDDQTALSFRVCLPETLAFSRVELVFSPAPGEGEPVSFVLIYQKTDAGVWYGVDVPPQREGAYFYLFRVEKEGQTFYLSKGAGGTAVLDKAEGAPFQQTVYAAGFQTPERMKGGIFYQIFPDRFCAGGRPKSVPAGRRLRADWGGVPQFLPNEKGKVENSDYFGGDLAGITGKLAYLQALGVTTLYLNPVFEAHSNHRYNTADFMKIDPLLGDENDFSALCAAAKRRGIRVILDGVFSHVGSDSRYFNRAGRYPGAGAYQGPESPYYDWFTFTNFPDEYKSWWGFDTLPEINKENESYRAMICGPGGVIETWLKRGASGFRLDVADELPDDFIYEIRAAVKRFGGECFLLGEVWEDATNKQSYGVSRHYLLGRGLDSVMNYPFRAAVIDFVRGGAADAFEEAVMTIVEHYPPPALHTLMNLLSTHDTPRVLTVLAGQPENGRDRLWQSQQTLSADEYEAGVLKLKAAAAISFFLPGMPCIYYGDEAGMQGYGDPFNRGCFPWGREDRALISFYQALGRARRACPALKEGRIWFLRQQSPRVTAFLREGAGQAVFFAANCGEEPAAVTLPKAGDGRFWEPAFDGFHRLPDRAGGVLLEPFGFCVFAC